MNESWESTYMLGSKTSPLRVQAFRVLRIVPANRDFRRLHTLIKYVVALHHWRYSSAKLSAWSYASVCSLRTAMKISQCIRLYIDEISENIFMLGSKTPRCEFKHIECFVLFQKIETFVGFTHSSNMLLHTTILAGEAGMAHQLLAVHHGSHEEPVGRRRRGVQTRAVHRRGHRESDSPRRVQVPVVQHWQTVGARDAEMYGMIHDATGISS